MASVDVLLQEYLGLAKEYGAESTVVMDFIAEHSSNSELTVAIKRITNFVAYKDEIQEALEE